ncbi:hypothetical protein ACFQX7_40605 [Luedemannella flava]
MGGLLLWTAILLAGLFLLFGAVRLIAVEPWYQQAEDRLNDIYGSQTANDKVRAVIDAGEVALSGYLLTGNPQLKRTYEKAAAEAPSPWPIC